MSSHAFETALLEPLWARLLVIVAGYALTLGCSGFIVEFFAGRQTPEKHGSVKPNGRRFEASMLIGKCENIITVTFVLADQITGLALIFAAKSLVRSEEIKKDAGYYLGGTLVNLVWSMAVGFIVRLLAVGA